MILKTGLTGPPSILFSIRAVPEAPVPAHRKVTVSWAASTGRQDRIGCSLQEASSPSGRAPSATVPSSLTDAALWAIRTRRTPSDPRTGADPRSGFRPMFSYGRRSASLADGLLYHKQLALGGPSSGTGGILGVSLTVRSGKTGLARVLMISLFLLLHSSCPACVCSSCRHRLIYYLSEYLSRTLPCGMFS